MADEHSSNKFIKIRHDIQGYRMSWELHGDEKSQIICLRLTF